MKLLNEFRKNFRVMFRNWMTVSLLIIAPLILILLIGYAFSSEDVTGIKIGVITNGSTDLTQLAQNVSSYGELVPMNDSECLAALERQDVHLCLEVSNLPTESNTTDFPTGSITYVYDNVRKRLSLSLIEGIKSFFGEQADEVSIETTESILNNIQNLLGFINDRKQDVLTIRNETLNIKQDLISRNQTLTEVRNDFLPAYFEIKDLQEQTHNISGTLEEQLNATSVVVSEARQSIASLREVSLNYSLLALSNVTLPIVNISDAFNASNLTDPINSSPINGSYTMGNNSENNPFTTNITAPTIASSVTEVPTLGSLLDGLGGHLAELDDLLNDTNGKVSGTVAQMDDIISKLDLVKLLLDEDLAATQEYLIKIDESVVRIDEVSAQMDQQLASLADLHPGLGEKLIKPITSQYLVLLPGAKNIQLAFPQLAAMILMFIALLFGNIATLMEVHDAAAVRNSLAPVKQWLFPVGLMLTSIAIIFLQAMVLFVVAQTMLGVSVFAHFGGMALFALLLITVFVLIGMLLAYALPSVQASILATTFMALVVFIFGNVMAPVESMPHLAQLATNANPLVIGQYSFGQVLLYGANAIGAGGLGAQAWTLVGYAIALLIAVLVVGKRRRH
ncbi:hypothetical protein AUJ68_06845 [Candidatus Woesearchaeota archaeon CG1_02_57_44]|nr:MAG: hypothetical protein AUJ68_06845 [Candidatus Woesearchaeota archaeon CG1_02_57_44]